MSKLLVTHTSHFIRGPDGFVYAPNTPIAYPFWTRYLAAFDHVTVAARVARVDRLPADLPRACGADVSFWDLPDYLGPWQYARRRSELAARLNEAARAVDAFCLRVPCPIATQLWRVLRHAQLPYGLEIVGDPQESLGRGTVRSWTRAVARRHAAKSLRAQCDAAQATAYVTERILQQSYPPRPGTYTTHYSSIELSEAALARHPRTEFNTPRRLVFVGSLAVLYKGPDVLLHALSRLQHPGVLLTIVGDGRERAGLVAMAGTLGVRPRVTFVGALTAGKPVRDALDAADLFVMPSRADALPRAMIEAMARGLPCIGTRVGGMAELLPQECLVPPNNPAGLARALDLILGDEERLRAASARNLGKAREFLAPVLAARRKAFYRYIRDHAATSAGNDPGHNAPTWPRSHLSIT